MLKATYEKLKEIIAQLMFLLLWGFPIKWAWNHTMTYIFGLPELTWLHAFCLIFVLDSLWKQKK